MAKENKKEKFIIKTVCEYTDQDGRGIIECKLISGVCPTGFTKFIGKVTMVMRTPQGMTTHPMSFPIDAPNIEKAFEKFDKLCKEEKVRVLNELGLGDTSQILSSSKKILRPGGMS